eukprot:TRINITY_DN40260_c0_g1_i1.p2 TRINITY_DN40260_c0_g1~~TRINITY_DN40260_c0_g1_i1.p2  ORF type:complete len:171 (-),score=45.55 TRINITY_DN40260_c0_g1_i1:95-607(-)
MEGVQREMKDGFDEAKHPSISKGKGCFVRLKDQIDKTVDKVDWTETTVGLVKGVQLLQQKLAKLVGEIKESVPEMLEDGYSVLWLNFEENALTQWRSLRGHLLPIVTEVAESSERLLGRLRSREELVLKEQAAKAPVAEPAEGADFSRFGKFGTDLSNVPPMSVAVDLGA